MTSLGSNGSCDALIMLATNGLQLSEKPATCMLLHFGRTGGLRKLERAVFACYLIAFSRQRLQTEQSAGCHQDSHLNGRHPRGIHFDSSRLEISPTKALLHLQELAQRDVGASLALFDCADWHRCICHVALASHRSETGLHHPEEPSFQR